MPSDCDVECQNGGRVRPDCTCQCLHGFTGELCEGEWSTCTFRAIDFLQHIYLERFYRIVGIFVDPKNLDYSW